MTCSIEGHKLGVAGECARCGQRFEPVGPVLRALDAVSFGPARFRLHRAWWYASAEMRLLVRASAVSLAWLVFAAVIVFS